MGGWMAASALATCEVADCALLAAPRRGRARSRQERCKLSRFAPASDPQRACVVFESISLANGIGNLGVGKVLDHSRGHFAHPGTAPSPVLGWVCGIMSGCGGGVLSEFANFVDDPTPHSRRPQKAHRRRFARALVGSSVIMLCVWPRSGRVEDFNDCDIEGPIALAALLFTLDGLGLASRALAWPLGSAAWLLPGFRSVFVPNLAGLANGPEATWGKLRARARRVIATAGVRHRPARRRAGAGGGIVHPKAQPERPRLRPARGLGRHLADGEAATGPPRPRHAAP